MNSIRTVNLDLDSIKYKKSILDIENKYLIIVSEYSEFFFNFS